jgi:Tfp pilus assembly protein PilF
MYEASDSSVPWDLYKHLAMAYEAQGKNEQAVKMYQEALNTALDAPDKEKQGLQASIDKLQEQ